MDPHAINKVLVAIDGSDRSLRTVKYIAGLKGLVNAEIHLFHVFQHIPESHYDLAREPSSIRMLGSMVGWEQHQRHQIENHMKKCRDILLAADFDPQRVKEMIAKRRQGVARDIIAAAQEGYDAVFIRRRGMTALAGVVMGSVAFKLLDGIHQAPLVFAGRKPDNRRILIGMDLSENALRAVAFVGRMTRGTGCKVALAAVMRRDQFPGEDDGSEENAGAKTDFGRAITDAFEKARVCLSSYGFDPESVASELITGAQSRAGALVELAEKGEYHTVVIGRKGVSSLDEFLIGRVSRKILYVGRKHHVWIVD